MIDKKIELDIKALKSFLEFWMKFHGLFNEMITKEIITKEAEARFFETKEMMKAKYDFLKKTLDFKYMPHSRLTDPVSDVLAVNNIRFMAERNLKKLNDDWKDSYIFLNNILERLNNKKRRLEQFNPVGVFVKRLLERR